MHVDPTSVSFGRTETWHAGWKGNQSSTDVRVNGEAAGVIEGAEDASISGHMRYTVRITRQSPAGENRVSYRAGIDSMREAKAHARYAITGQDRSRHNRKSGRPEGRVGGPCHAIKSDGYWCLKSAVMVASDGYGYCKRHTPPEG